MRYWVVEIGQLPQISLCMPEAENCLDKPTVDVCIATYLRPMGLRRLLQSLLEQQHSDEFAVVVSVADNDRQESARAVCKAFAAQGMRLHYTVVRTPNIALARNAAIQACSGRYIAILDDDETASPGWLQAYWTAAQRSGADVMHGPVRFRFPPDSSTVLRHSMVFAMAPELPAGASVGYERCTTNCCIRREAMNLLPQLFDPAFGTSGGEDTDFFRRLSATPAVFAWVPDAGTTEVVPAARMRVVYLLHRYFRFGINLARHERTNRVGLAQVRQTWRHARWSVRALARMTLEHLRRRAVPAFNALLRATFSAGYVVNMITRWSFKRYW